jgi:acetyl esterase/lipase
MEGLIPTVTAESIPLMRETSFQEPLTNEMLSREGAFEVSEISVPGRDGDPDVPLLICRPTQATAPVPVVYWIHGGGQVLGDNRAGLLEPLDWATEFNMAVVSVEYRLATETPFPGPVEDCYAGLMWVSEHAAEIGGDPERIIIAGPSGGGALAAAATLLARDRQGPTLLGQMLIYPMLDDRNDSYSSRQMAGLGVWDTVSNQNAWTAVLGDARGSDDVSPYAAAARASNLSGLPPTFIDCASAETFRDEDVDYATRIWRDGGVAELHVWPGGFHGFDMFAPQVAISQEAVAARVRWLRRLLNG